MTVEPQFKPFTSPADNGWAEAMDIYHSSFPKMEQREEDDLVRALEHPAFSAEGIWCGGTLAGFLFHWKHGDWYYVEHLAISPALRGRNTGSEALRSFCRRKRVVLEIDPPEDEISIRRLHFYQRIGFTENPYTYIHPSYRLPPEPHRLVLMSYPDPLPEDEARGFADFVRETVLRYSKQESPKLPKLP